MTDKMVEYFGPRLVSIYRWSMFWCLMLIAVGRIVRLALHA